ncbi:uncharacterized protein B0H64DRAFT_379054 [Chaetomium fimeti]|uniref:Zn(2)-C6 fungal-type domain-containing protein n=1 Tax=Chaetomium fimeti TaxID=1854472 RepID=A0AAE0HP38_9PEZI|nr:hypothetical protein B0H64DRAFT_379054 [Chaetomium fimeti]
MSISDPAHYGPDQTASHQTASHHTGSHQTAIAISLAESVHCFRTTAADRPRSSIRAKFTIEEREKVLGVRRQGACLRCRMLKIQCSLENPCQPCLQSAIKGSERKVLSFCYCVRTRFADVNIFDPSSSWFGAATTMQTESLMLAMSKLLGRIATPANFSLTSNPIAFNNTMVSWLTDPDFHLPNGSIVGLCCSSLLGLQFPEDTAAGTDGLLADFRSFLLATSLTHARWRDSSLKVIQARDICAAGQVSGYRLLKRLDRILTPQFLSRIGRESCQVLFLLVLGAVLGVGYSASQLEDHSPRLPSAEMLSPEFQRSPTLWLAMKEHLCQMLAHHLIFVGSMLGIKLETAVEQRIIDTAVSRWNKAEEFVWADAVGCKREEVDSPSALGATGGSPEAAKAEGGNTTSVLPDRSRGVISSTPPSPSPAPPRQPPPLLVPIPTSEAAPFHSQPVEAWSENPTSYLSMFDESATPAPGSSEPRSVSAMEGTASPPKTVSEPSARQQTPESMRPRERKRRSMWIVRPFDAGPEHGLINVHARLQGCGGLESLRTFV